MHLHSLRAPSAKKLEVLFDAFDIPVQATVIWMDSNGEPSVMVTAAVQDPFVQRPLMDGLRLLDLQPALW